MNVITKSNVTELMANAKLDVKSMKLLANMPTKHQNASRDILLFNQITDKLNIHGAKLYYELSKTIDKKTDGYSFTDFVEKYLDGDKGTASRMKTMYEKFGINADMYKKELDCYYDLIDFDTTTFNITSLSLLASLDIKTLKALCCDEILTADLTTKQIRKIVPMAKSGDFDGIRDYLSGAVVHTTEENKTEENKTEENKGYTMSFGEIEYTLDEIKALIDDEYCKCNKINAIVWHNDFNA